MALRESQDITKEFGRPEYADLISRNLIELPLTPGEWPSRSAAEMRRSARRMAGEVRRPDIGDGRFALLSAEAPAGMQSLRMQL